MHVQNYRLYHIPPLCTVLLSTTSSIEVWIRYHILIQHHRWTPVIPTCMYTHTLCMCACVHRHTHTHTHNHTHTLANLTKKRIFLIQLTYQETVLILPYHYTELQWEGHFKRNKSNLTETSFPGPPKLSVHLSRVTTANEEKLGRNQSDPDVCIKWEVPTLLNRFWDLSRVSGFQAGQATMLLKEIEYPWNTLHVCWLPSGAHGTAEYNYSNKTWPSYRVAHPYSNIIKRTNVISLQHSKLTQPYLKHIHIPMKIITIITTIPTTIATKISTAVGQKE